MTAEKKVKGRKRHISTDINGNLLFVKVHAANIHDTVAGCDVFDETYFWHPTIKGVCVDAGYRGTFKEYVERYYPGVTVDISERIKPEWEILPKRWRVERSLSWLNNYRRLSKDYEISTNSEESQIYIAFSSVLLNRLFPCV